VTWQVLASIQNPAKKKNYLMLVKPLRSRDHQNHGREGKRQQVVLEGLSSTADGWLPSSRLEHILGKQKEMQSKFGMGEASCTIFTGA